MTMEVFVPMIEKNTQGRKKYKQSKLQQNIYEVTSGHLLKNTIGLLWQMDIYNEN